MASKINHIEVTYTLGFTRKLKEFNNIKPEFTLTVNADVDKLADADGLKDAVKEKVEEWLFTTLDEIQEVMAKELG